MHLNTFSEVFAFEFKWIVDSSNVFAFAFKYIAKVFENANTFQILLWSPSRDPMKYFGPRTLFHIMRIEDIQYSIEELLFKMKTNLHNNGLKYA